jgi:hypothetical protein
MEAKIGVKFATRYKEKELEECWKKTQIQSMQENKRTNFSEKNICKNKKKRYKKYECNSNYN